MNIDRRIVSRQALIVAGVAASMLAGSIHAASAATVLLNSFENTLNGYTYASTDPNYMLTFSQAYGVTNGSYSLEYSSTAANLAGSNSGPNYSNYISSGTFSTALTQTLSTASAINVDYFLPSSSFGYLQTNFAVQTNAPGYPYVEIGAFSSTYAPTVGSEDTVSYPIPASLNAALVADIAAGYGTQLTISFGGSGGSTDSLYLDNITATVPATIVPEPVSASLLAVVGGAALARRRRA